MKRGRQQGAQEDRDTMEIISTPNPDEFKHAATCQQCHTQLRVTIKDFLRVIHDQRDGSATVYRCPMCNHENWVDLKLIRSSSTTC
jgi:uncharacterized protein with PIN domain